jgi:molybdate transport system substrate-binding protein
VRRVAIAFVVVAFVAGGCRVERPADESRTGELVVYAAASLLEPLERLDPAWRRARPDVELTVSSGSSTALRTQLEQGAAADVFLAADTDNPEALAAAGLTAGAPVPFATNGLAVIVPDDNPAAIVAAADLARPGVRILAAGPGVPISRYAAELVEQLGIAAGYARNVVSREDDVRAVVAKLALGEGDAAIVYRTEAAADGVRQIALPPGIDVRATYAAAVIAAGRDGPAREFVAWLTQPAAQAILRDLGFLPPP